MKAHGQVAELECPMPIEDERAAHSSPDKPGPDAPGREAAASDPPVSDSPASDSPASDPPASDSPASDSPASAPSAESRRRLGPVARVMWLLIRGYQLAMAGRPSPCRFWPTCSTYALEAVERHGARRGGWLAARRLLRCHPWGPHGVDPVPE